MLAVCLHGCYGELMSKGDTMTTANKTRRTISLVKGSSVVGTSKQGTVHKADGVYRDKLTGEILLGAGCVGRAMCNHHVTTNNTKRVEIGQTVTGVLCGTCFFDVGTRWIEVVGNVAE